MTTAPRSVDVRISRPNPCFNRSAAWGSASWLNESRSCSARAAKTGSVGTANGRRTTITQLSRSPGTSMPSQKVDVPSSSVRSVSWNDLSNWRRCPSMPWPREVRGQAYERLVVEVERGRQHQLLDVVGEADARAEVIERPAHRQRRGREDDGASLGVDAVAQQHTNVERRRAQQHCAVLLRLREPVHPVRMRGGERFADEQKRALQASADDLQLAHALVGFVTAEPIPRLRHRRVKHGLQRRKRRGCVLTRERYVVPVFVFTQPRSEPERFLAALAVA